MGIIKSSLFIFLFFSALTSFAWQGTPPGSLACAGTLQVSLDDECEAEITPDMILQGSHYAPYDQYRVRISNVSGTIVTKPGTYTVTVTQISNGNSCWSTIKVEDKLAPQVVNCPCEFGSTDPACQFVCTDLGAIQNGTLAVPTPTVEENCGSFTTRVTDNLVDLGCNGRVLQRTYTYTDEAGNVSTSCTAYYRLRNASLSDITAPNPDVQLTCGANTSPAAIVTFFTPTIGLAAAQVNAFPTINGTPITQGGVCNILASFTDTDLVVCGATCNSRKVLRTWIVIDWCTSQTTNFIQVIKATDEIPPVVDADDITASVDPWGCVSNIMFPLPRILTDNCDANPTYRVRGPVGVQIIFHVATQRFIAIDVPKGVHEFIYEGVDCCDNIGRDTITVTVSDRTAPVAIAKQNVVVSLTHGVDGSGIAKVFAPSIDNGSHDGCTNVKLEVRRDTDLCDIRGNATYNADGHPQDGNSNPNSPGFDPDNGAFVSFCCADIDQVDPVTGVGFGLVKVWLRVWDDGDMDGIFGSAGDNYNETWAQVRVENKLAPKIVCPANITIDCDRDPEDTTITGVATAAATCGTATVTFVDTPNLNACGIGTISRRWSIVGNPAIFCIQTITIRPSTPFNGSTIVYPADVTTDCRNITTYQPTWVSGPCDIVGYSVKADTFKFEDGACFKILNHYTVVDWCQYDPNVSQTVGIWKGTQIVKVIDQTKPVVACRDTMFAVNDDIDADGDNNKCEVRNITLTASATDQGDCQAGWLKWSVFVDLNADGIDDYEYSSFLPTGDNAFNDSNLNGVPDIYLAPTSSGQSISIRIPVDVAGPMSNHKVSYKVTDGCGNFGNCTSTFMVVDKKKPTPYCISLSSALMHNGMVELWAKDFDLGSFDNCTAQENLLFTFYNEQPILTRINETHFFKGIGQAATQAEYDAGQAQKWIPATKSSGKVFTCANLPITNVQMTVWDEKLNFEFCMVTLSLLDNQNACGPGGNGTIGGTISSPNNNDKTLDGSGVSLVGNLPELSRNSLTGANGTFQFTNVPKGQDYSLMAEMDKDHNNGVSTLDLVLMQRHILALERLDSPFKVIAADVNGDQRITAADLVELRKLILGIHDKFAQTPSWLIIPKGQTFADAQNPWSFDTEYQISNFQTSTSTMHFDAIKMGDVNFSAEMNFTGENETEARTNRTFELILENELMAAGVRTLVPVYAKNAEILHGLQARFAPQGVNIYGVKPGQLNVQDQNFHVAKGLVAISWNDATSTKVNTEEPLFYIDVMSEKSVSTASIIGFETSTIKPEAYVGEQITATKMVLTTRSATTATKEFALAQNEPNPFSSTTNISFYAPSAGEAVLTIQDVTGKLVLTQKQSVAAGENSFTVRSSQLGVTGVLFYTVELEGVTATKKMINLE